MPRPIVMHGYRKSSLVRGSSAAFAAGAASSGPALRLVPAAVLEPCEAALAAVVDLVRSESCAQTRVDVRGPRLHGNVNAAVAALPSALAIAEEQLCRALRGFEPEMALKLRALLLGGRHVREIPAVGCHGTLDGSESAVRALARDFSESGPLAGEWLRRGFALACAAGIPLEQPVCTWSTAIAKSLDERAWLSFGRQLAKSEPEDWQCVALLDAEAKQIKKLYLKWGDYPWWSFQAQIERPSAAIVHKQGRALERRRSAGMVVGSLRRVTPQLRAPEGRALRRAARAIQARVGEVTNAR